MYFVASVSLDTPPFDARSGKNALGQRRIVKQKIEPAVLSLFSTVSIENEWRQNELEIRY